MLIAPALVLPATVGFHNELSKSNPLFSPNFLITAMLKLRSIVLRSATISGVLKNLATDIGEPNLILIIVPVSRSFTTLLMAFVNKSTGFVLFVCLTCLNANVRFGINALATFVISSPFHFGNVIPIAAFILRKLGLPFIEILLANKSFFASSSTSKFLENLILPLSACLITSLTELLKSSYPSLS